MLQTTRRGTAAVLRDVRRRERATRSIGRHHRHSLQTWLNSPAASTKRPAACVLSKGVFPISGLLRGRTSPGASGISAAASHRRRNISCLPRPDGKVWSERRDGALQRVLLISPLWPEASSSAAGVRTMGLIESFLSWGWEVTYLSPAARNEHTDRLEQKSVATYSMKPNRSEELQSLLHEVNPTVCMFDRFYAEEAFSFVVRESCPDALRILDTQDLHFLRNGRHEVLKKFENDEDCIRKVVGCVPSAESDGLLRELAALHRSDLSIMCSPVEIAMLEQHYQMSPSKLALSSFHYPPPQRDTNPGYHSRRHFMTIGNFKHPPNMDSVKWLSAHVWGPIRDGLRKQGLDAEMHVYGAYPTKEASQLHNPARGFHVLGHAPSLEIMRNYRVCLCPIRFGAGLKGKVLDSWLHGLPVCTTPVAAEGLFRTGFPKQGDLASWLEGGLPLEARHNTGHEAAQPWGGTWTATCATEIVRDAIELYTDERLWTECQDTGYDLLESLFAAKQNAESLREEIYGSLRRVHEQRKGDFTAAMLWHQGNRATEYFSRWIELKETGASSKPEAPLK